jgi:hypothetical protein
MNRLAGMAAVYPVVSAWRVLFEVNTMKTRIRTSARTKTSIAAVFNAIAGDISLLDFIDKALRTRGGAATPCTDEAWRESLSAVSDAIDVMRFGIERVGTDGVTAVHPLLLLVRQTATLIHELALNAISRGVDSDELAMLHDNLMRGGPIRTPADGNPRIVLCGPDSDFIHDLAAGERWVRRERGKMNMGIAAKAPAADDRTLHLSGFLNKKELAGVVGGSGDNRGLKKKLGAAYVPSPDNRTLCRVDMRILNATDQKRINELVGERLRSR